MPGIAIIARQRSGTNFLRSLIANSTNFVNLSEVFDHTARGSAENFFRFRDETGFEWQPLREQAACVSELAAFFGKLQTMHPHHIVDIKYNQTLVCIPTYISPSGLLPVFQALQQQKYCFVHLVRQNVCASIVSGMVANVTGTFHVPKDHDAPAAPVQIRLDPAEFIAEIGRREREIALFDHLCRWMGNNIRLRYEDVAGYGVPQLTALVKDLARRGGGGFTALGESAFRKGLGHWLDHVENRAEIEDALSADARLSYYLGGAPPSASP